jgi:hypothetical protein
VSIFIPINNNFLLIRYKQYNTFLYIYTNNKYLSFNISFIDYYNLSNTLLINYNNCLSECIVNNYLTNFLIDWDSIFIKKIRFKGKGYKIVKFKNRLYMVFNKSHITWCLLFKVLCIKFLKNKYIFIYKNFKYLNYILYKLYNIRPLNLFTKRGIRLTRQKVFKKIGKRTT